MGKIKTNTKEKPDIRCCKNCNNMVEFPRNNRYGDVDHFCMVTGYFLNGVGRDITKVKRYTPGGRELECIWKPRKTGADTYVG